MIRKILHLLGLRKEIQPDLLELPSPSAVEKKLCSVCRYKHEDSAAGIHAAKCMAPQNLRFDLVTGEQKRVWDYCSTHRDERPRNDLCGSSGGWFIQVEYIVIKRSK